MKDASLGDILKREEYWGQDLSVLYPAVETYYNMIETEGMKQAYEHVLAESEASLVKDHTDQ